MDDCQRQGPGPFDLKRQSIPNLIELESHGQEPKNENDNSPTR